MKYLSIFKRNGSNGQVGSWGVKNVRLIWTLGLFNIESVSVYVCEMFQCI